MTSAGRNGRNVPADIPGFLVEILNLKPTDEVIVCGLLHRVILIVARFRLEQIRDAITVSADVRKALRGWELLVMTKEELESRIDQAVTQFCGLESISNELGEAFIGEGIFDADDLKAFGVDAIARHFGVSTTLAQRIVLDADSIQ